MEDWNRLEEFMTPENLLQCGIDEYSVLAQCLGPNIVEKYQVHNGLLLYCMTTSIYHLIVTFHTINSLLQQYVMSTPGIISPNLFKVSINVYHHNEVCLKEYILVS